MTLLQLKYFTALALLENTTQASKLFNISQSSLSKNILKLEEELGVSLFDRNGRRISLNAAGERFLISANTTLEEMNHAASDLQTLMSGDREEINIGMTGVYRPLMDCIRVFSEDHPQTCFNIQGSIEKINISDINDFDALVFPDESRYRKLGGYSLYKESFLLAVPRGDPLSNNLYVTEKDLEKQKLIFLRAENVPEYPFLICNAVLSGFSARGFVNTQEFHRTMIANGCASGFVRETDQSFYSHDKIKLLPIRSSRFKRNMKICFKRDKHLNAGAKAFRDFIISRLDLKP